ncbi:MAG: ribonuclease III [Oscillospiraceae bacterium]|nr:ribonuclease III [Oscillospiraceae bacterium]
MLDYLKPLPSGKLSAMSTLGLAHIGDAVFELMVRTYLIVNGVTSAKQLHSKAVERVSAKAQASTILRLLDELSEEETLIYKRGRNANVNTVPRGSTIEEYHIATGIETLIGYLYLKDERERLNALFTIIMEM